METFLAVALLFSFLRHSDVPTDTLATEDYSFGSFQRATRLAVSPQGWFYVVDEQRNIVEVFHAPSSAPQEIGGFGFAAGAFDRPSGISTDGLNVFVADFGNHRIQRFDRNLNFVSSLSTRDTTVPSARFGYPMGVSVSTSGDLFILDGENLRIVRFSQDGRFLQTFGGVESERGKLQHPLKISVSEDDRILVAEPNRLVEFDYFGNFVKTIGEGQVANLRSCDILKDGIVAVSKDTLYWFSNSGDLTWKRPLKELLLVNDVVVDDVAIRQRQLFLLEEKRLIVLSLSFR